MNNSTNEVLWRHQNVTYKAHQMTSYQSSESYHRLPRSSGFGVTRPGLSYVSDYRCRLPQQTSTRSTGLGLLVVSVCQSNRNAQLTRSRLADEEAERPPCQLHPGLAPCLCLSSTSFERQEQGELVNQYQIQCWVQFRKSCIEDEVSQKAMSVRRRPMVGRKHTQVAEKRADGPRKKISAQASHKSLRLATRRSLEIVLFRTKLRPLARVHRASDCFTRS